MEFYDIYRRMNPLYSKYIDSALPFKQIRRVSILVVVDPDIRFAGYGFGISRVIEIIRNAQAGGLRFDVDVARRGSGAPAETADPEPDQARYVNFRFDMAGADGEAVIDRYDQVWCFGFEPGNSGSQNDALIDADPLAANAAELAKLADWMKVRRGGLFGTGDHHFLGASLCARIPRLGSMRRWSNADGVPTIGGETRYDTLRAPDASYHAGGQNELRNTPNQGDATPQPINWAPWRPFLFVPFLTPKRPHPVLCHPTLGAIDVMPDHAHEGLLWETDEIDLGARLDYYDNEPEYPDALDGGRRPTPLIIARGDTIGSDQLNFEKGPQPHRTDFPMIGVYDGHAAGVGRVATDSTWHHWFDLNIAEIENVGGDTWQKIKRYFINLAVWLNPPERVAGNFYRAVFESHFAYPGFQEYTPKSPVLDLGRAFRQHISADFGPCGITDRVIDVLQNFEDLLIPFPELIPQPRPFLSLPPWQALEDAVLGGLVRASYEPAQQIKEAAKAGKTVKLEASSFEDMMLPGVAPALKEFSAALQQDVSMVAEQAKALGAAKRVRR